MALTSDPQALDRVASAFRGLGHPTRLEILAALEAEAVLSPSQMLEHLRPGIALANVAYHTRELATLGLLRSAGHRPARGALEHFYRLSPHGRELIELAERAAALTR